MNSEELKDRVKDDLGQMLEHTASKRTSVNIVLRS